MKQKLQYWIPTALVILMMGSGGVFDILRTEDVMAAFRHLGYPDYFPLMLGVAKLLGVAALLVPMVPPLLKEWAYAGFTFDLIAAFISHLSVGDRVELIPPVIGLVAVTVSGWAWRKQRAAI